MTMPRPSDHKTVEAVVRDIANGLFAGEVESLIASPPYETTVSGKTLLLERCGERFEVTVRKLRSP
jgi:hypothetical protein